MWINSNILELELRQMPRLLTQRSYVDTRANSRAKTATNAVIIHKTVSIQ